MTPHSQDMLWLRFRSTFSGAPLISFRQHHPVGWGLLGSGNWASGVSQQGGGETVLTGSLRPGYHKMLLRVRMHFYSTRVLSLCVPYSERFQDCFD